MCGDTRKGISPQSHSFIARRAPPCFTSPSQTQAMTLGRLCTSLGMNECNLQTSQPSGQKGRAQDNLDKGLGSSGAPASPLLPALGLAGSEKCQDWYLLPRSPGFKGSIQVRALKT